MYDENRNTLQQDAYRYDNPDINLDAFVITLQEENLNCANTADGLFETITQYADDYKVFIIDFTNVKQASEVFFYKYIKYLLQSKLKIYNFKCYDFFHIYTTITLFY